MAAFIDLTVVDRPMDYVSAKLCLDRLPPGTDLDLLVPSTDALDALRQELVYDGHEFISVTPADGSLTLRVRKGIGADGASYMI